MIPELSARGRRPILYALARRLHRRVVPLLLPFAACALQWVCWNQVRPFSWFFFYPAVFFSSWLGGFGVGVISTCISAFLGLYFFIPPAGSLRAADLNNLYSVALFAAMGILFSFIHRRLAQSTLQTQRALEDSRKANEKLRTLNEQLRARDESRAVALKESESLYRLISENTADVIWVLDLKTGRFTYVSPSVKKLRGYTPVEVLEQTMEEALTPESYRAVEQLPRRIAAFLGGDASAREMISEVDQPRKDGSIVSTEVVTTLLRGSGGQVAEILGVTRDITARKRAETELRNSRQLLNEMGRIARVGGWDFDPETRHVAWTDEVARIHGLEPGPGVNIDVGLSYYEPQSRAAVSAALERAVMFGEAYDLEMELNSAQGDHRWVRSIGQPVMENGRVVRVRGSLQDISERRRAEAQIRELNLSLEQRVAERTAELAAANRELEAFSYSVSHDLRAPLRAIDGFTRALADSSGAQIGDTGRAHIQRVLAAAERMGNLIDDLLGLARITRSELERTPVNLSGIARAIAEELKQRDPERDVEVSIGEGIAAYGDSRLLRAMMENLLGNAWKFTSNTARARIEFGAETDAEGRRTCHIRDNGAGFDMNYVHKLFGPFQRLHSAAEYPGTGIGLATVQRIVNRHGGQIWASAQPGAGATFYFHLPECK
jgi:PAS domain S-box-containing protein